MLQNPSVCRGGTPCTPNTLEEALHCCVFHSALPAKAIADALGVKYTYLANASDPHRGDTHFQSRWFLPLLQVTGNLGPLRYLAASLDCAIVPLPSAATTDPAIYERVADVVRELGEDVAMIQRALADGHITAEESAQFDREIHDSIEALLSLQAAVRAKSRDLAHLGAASPAAVEALESSSSTVAGVLPVGGGVSCDASTAKPAPVRMSLPQAPARRARA